MAVVGVKGLTSSCLVLRVYPQERQDYDPFKAKAKNRDRDYAMRPMNEDREDETGSDR